MKLKDAVSAVHENGCKGCECLKEDNDGFECTSSSIKECEEHKKNAYILLGKYDRVASHIVNRGYSRYIDINMIRHFKCVECGRMAEQKELVDHDFECIVGDAQELLRSLK